MLLVVSNLKLVIDHQSLRTIFPLMSNLSNKCNVDCQSTPETCINISHP